MNSAWGIFISLILLSCSTTKKPTANARGNQDSTVMKAGATVPRPQDGRSFETAIIINETNESDGIHAEYVWIEEHYPGFKEVQQALDRYDKKPFDIITIQLPNGRKQNIYFDISKFLN